MAEAPGPLDAAGLRAALPRTWDALLARHGRPTAVQLAAAPVLLGGRDALVCAPTAAGKTLAYLAPLVEQVVPPGEGPARLLVVAPTRALVNDLVRRIAGPLGRMGVRVGRWTGDHHDGGRPQPVTVLTPEALDARLARDPRALRAVEALVLDELHVLDGTVRGDHLRVVARRLRVERRDETGPLPLQVVAASATVADPRGLAGRYLPGAVVVQAGEARPARVRICRGRGSEAVAAHLEQAVRDGFRKVLLFVDSRSGVEELAQALRGRPPFGGAVLAHHGSLSRRARLDAEARFQRAPAAVCVATSTLELGIDIGDIDLVALSGPPSDLAALSQRIGRGRRRGGAHPVLALAEDPLEERLFRVLFALRRDDRWPEEPVTFHAGVLVQQATVLAATRASRTVDAGALARRLPPDLAAEWTPVRLLDLLEAVAAGGWILPTGTRGPGGPRFRLGQRGEELWHRGGLHVNLAEGPQTEVVDALTGQVLARVDEVEAGASLGGRAVRTLADQGERVVVQAGGGGGSSRFGGRSGPRWRPGLSRLALQGLGLPWRARCRDEDGATLVVHGLGDAGAFALARVLCRAGVCSPGQVRSKGPFGLVLRGLPDWSRWPDPRAVDAFLDDEAEGLGEALGLGPFHPFLPLDEQRRVVAGAVHAEGLRAWLAGAPPEVVDLPAEGRAAARWRGPGAVRAGA